MSATAAASRRTAIHGFDNDARRLFCIALHEGVRIDAFVDDGRSAEYEGIRWLNKPVIAAADLAAGDIVLVPWGRPAPANLPPGVRIGHINADRELREGRPLLVVGNAGLAPYAAAMLAKLGLNPTAFVDFDGANTGGGIRGSSCGTPTPSPSWPRSGGWRPFSSCAAAASRTSGSICATRTSTTRRRTGTT